MIEVLAHYYSATTRQITQIRLGKIQTTESDEHNTNALVEALRDEGFVRTRPSREEKEADGNLNWMAPVHGLTAAGVEFAKENGMSDPLEFNAERSVLNFQHDLKRADTRFRIELLCEEKGWILHWRKTDLYRTVEPDDLFAITKPETGDTSYVFFEQENKKKTFEKLYEKVRRYYDIYGTDKCLKEWGDFKTFTVIFQFSNEERRTNFLRFITGECDCRHYRGKLKHTCLPHGLREKPLKVSNIWTTTDELVAADIGGDIFKPLKDHATATRSFLAL